MRRLLPGLLLCLVGGIAWWLLGMGDGNVSQDPQTSRAAGELGGPGTSADPSTDRLESSSTDLQRMRLADAQSPDLDLPSVIGTVRWMDGKPAADIAVELLDKDSSERLQVTHTDADGNYRLILHTEEGEVQRTCQVLCPGWSADDHYATAIPQVPPDRLDLRIAQGFPLKVITTDAQGGLPVEGMYITATDQSGGDAEVFAVTDSDGIAKLRIPMEGAWSFWANHGGYYGRDASAYRVQWVEAGTEELRMSVAPPPSSLSLRAVDSRTGRPIPDAAFRPATAPDDHRDLGRLGLAEFPEDWEAHEGRLDLRFLTPGRAFLHVHAPGFHPEVVEWVGRSDRTHDVPLLPLREVAVRVTKRGEPAQATVTTAVNRRTMVLPTGDLFEEIASNTYAGGLVDHESDALGQVTLLLPDPSEPGAPRDFDLWMRIEGQRRYFGTLSWHRLPEPPWHFEMEPPMGEVELEVLNLEDRPLADLSFQVTAEVEGASADSIREGQYGRQSAIVKTDAEGRASAHLPAPAIIRITGNRSQGTGEFQVEGRLEADGVLVMPIRIQRATEEVDEIATRGRVEMRGLEGSAHRETLWLRLAPLDAIAKASKIRYARAYPVDDDHHFTVWTPPGRYRLWCWTETMEAAVASGRHVDFQAGQEDIRLRLPEPHALKVHVVDAVTREGVPVEEVLYRDATGKPFSLDTWEGDFAVGYTLFEDRVELIAIAEGYAPGHGQASLRQGILNEVTILIRPGRDLPVRMEEPLQEGQRLRLHWLDAPGADQHHVFHLDDLMRDMPTGKAHLRAYLDGQPLHDIHLDEESTEIVIDLGASQYFPPQDGR